MSSDGFYALLIRATLVTAVLLGLVAAMTAMTLDAPVAAVWVVAAAAVVWWAATRIRRRSRTQPLAQTKSNATSS